jgi:hypothetical protein
VRDVTHACIRGPVDGDRDHVEATADLGQPAGLQIQRGQLAEPPSLGPRHGGGRIVAPACLTAFDLHEDDRLAVAAHEVDLAEGEADVALDHVQSGLGEEGGGRRFRRLAPRAPVIHPDSVIARAGCERKCRQSATAPSPSRPALPSVGVRT